jgi:hypothetical protein
MTLNVLRVDRHEIERAEDPRSASSTPHGLRRLLSVPGTLRWNGARWCIAALIAVSFLAPQLLALQPSAPVARPISAEDSLDAQREVYHPYRRMITLRGPVWAPRRAHYRRELLKRLPIGLGLIPGDDWLASLQLTYAVPGRPSIGSREGLAACQTSRWWCDLLFVYVNQRAGRYAAADSLLEEALVRMPPEVRCVWGDVSMLITESAVRKQYERMACDERARFEDRLWWLADPVHSVMGNERRVDHFAREVSLRRSLEEDIASVPGYGWGLTMVRKATQDLNAADVVPVALAALVPANGKGRPPSPPKGFLWRAYDVRKKADPLDDAEKGRDWFSRYETALRAHSVAPSRGAAPLQYVPAAVALEAPFLAEPRDWDPVAKRPMETSYALVAGTYGALDHQHAFFLRGDSARLVVVTDVRTSDVLRRGLVRAALAVSRSPTDERRVVRTPGGPRFELSMMVAPDSMLASLEVFALGANWGRVRFGAVPPGLSARSADDPAGTTQRQTATRQRLRLSDVALFDAPALDTSQAIDLETVLPSVHATTRFVQGTKLGLFWEVYGLQPGDTAAFSVRALREPASVEARTAARLGRRAQPAEPVMGVSWKDSPAEGKEIEPRRVIVDLSSLAPGWYSIELAAGVNADIRATVVKRIEITRR